MPCRPTKDRQVMVESLKKCSPLEKETANHFSILALRTPWTVWKDKKIWNCKINFPGHAQYATGKKLRNSSKRNKEVDPKWKPRLVVHVSGGETEVQCSKEQHCIRSWNVRSMNQGKLEVVKQEMARVNIDILGISEIKWIRMGKFNSGDHCIYF